MTAQPLPESYSVAVRNLCEFAAKLGDLDLRFTPSPSAQQGREGHQLVASRRGPGHEAEVRLSGTYVDGAKTLVVSGRADGFDAARNVLEEVKTFRGSVEGIAPNHSALHWAQLKVYGWLMCQTRALAGINLHLVYFDVQQQTEHPIALTITATDLQVFFNALCARYLGWAQMEMAHRMRRDSALQAMAFPQAPFRPGQHNLASGVYRACVQSRPLLVQAPTGIGKTIGTVFPALRAMPERGVDKIFFLTAKTPGRQVALEALQKVVASQVGGVEAISAEVDNRQAGSAGAGGRALRVLELVARDKACEHPDKACHGQSCPLAQGFYDRLGAARQAAAQRGWLDQSSQRSVALAHGVCPYYLGHEMVRWADVVVGDYNYYFDRTAMLYALTANNNWRVSVLVDEAHNLYSRACSMYSAELVQAEALALRTTLPTLLRVRLDEWLNQWQLLVLATKRKNPDTTWCLLDELPEGWLRALQRFNSTVSEHLNEHPTDTHGALLPFYFKTLAFGSLAEEFGEHSLCELELGATIDFGTDSETVLLRLRNIVPAPFIKPRVDAADSLVLFSATLNPPDYYINLLGLADDTQLLDIPSSFVPEQLAVSIVRISTRRDDRLASLDELVNAMAEQYARHSGNYLAFFSSFDYMELALARLQQLHPALPVWAQQRQMGEASRHAFLRQFDAAGQGIGFAVLGGVFGEGVDLPGRRLVGAFIATLGLPQFDALNKVICERMQARFGRGYDYTYLFPGMQKVVQAAGRVIRSPTDTGSVVLLDERYREWRYRRLLPAWCSIPVAPLGLRDEQP